MYIEKHIPNRQKGENLVLFLRRHKLIMFGHWAFNVFLALIPVGLYYFFNYNYPYLLAGKITLPFLLLLASVYYLFVLLFLFNSFLDYNLDVWIVTSKRIINIEQKGLFHREIAEHELDKIQDVTAVQKGILQTFFSYGDVTIQTAAEIQIFTFHQVNDPFEVARIINHLIKEDTIKVEIQQPKKNKEQEE